MYFYYDLLQILDNLRNVLEKQHLLLNEVGEAVSRAKEQKYQIYHIYVITIILILFMQKIYQIFCPKFNNVLIIMLMDQLQFIYIIKVFKL
jgi:hypothetical protein